MTERIDGNDSDDGARNTTHRFREGGVEIRNRCESEPKRIPLNQVNLRAGCRRSRVQGHPGVLQYGDVRR